MNKDLFGIDIENPPYRFTGIDKNGFICLEPIKENWIKDSEGISQEYLDKFDYFKCQRGSMTWFRSEEKKVL